MTVIIPRVATVLLTAILGVAWPMCRAGQNAVLAQSNIVARFWEHVGSTGRTLESFVDRLAAQWGIDISNYMIARAHGWE